MTVAQTKQTQQPSLNAGLLFFVRSLLPEDLQKIMTLDFILELTGASRSRAYEICRRLPELLPRLFNPPGRKQVAVADSATAAISSAVIEYLMENPGAVCRTGAHARYSDDFRRFVVSLAQQADDLTVRQMSELIRVPEGTLKDWLNPGTYGGSSSQAAVSDTEPGSASGGTAAAHPSVAPAQTDVVPTQEQSDLEPQPAVTVPPYDPLEIYCRHADVRTIITQYRHWTGDFVSFYDHLRKHHSIPHGRTFISTLLQAVGLRSPRRSPGTAYWSRGTFRNLFPGAHWMGDGTTMAIAFNGHWHVFNVQAVVDTASDAVLSFEVTGVEDEAAVLAAWSQALRTANGHAPVMLTLDGKPCNHTTTVEQTIVPAILIRSTPGRGGPPGG